MDHEWRCKRCEKLLGRTEGKRLHLQFGRKRQYLVGPPVTTACWSCGAINEYPRGQPEKDRKANL